jgi:hypothetical protein
MPVIPQWKCPLGDSFRMLPLGGASACSFAARDGFWRASPKAALRVGSPFDLREAQPASAILDMDLSPLVLPHQHLAFRRSVVTALRLQLQQPALVAHHPIQTQHALLFQAKERVQLRLGWAFAMEAGLELSAGQAVVEPVSRERRSRIAAWAVRTRFEPKRLSTNQLPIAQSRPPQSRASTLKGTLRGDTSIELPGGHF